MLCSCSWYEISGLLLNPFWLFSIISAVRFSCKPVNLFKMLWGSLLHWVGEGFAVSPKLLFHSHLSSSPLNYVFSCHWENFVLEICSTFFQDEWFWIEDWRTPSSSQQKARQLYHSVTKRQRNPSVLLWLVAFGCLLWSNRHCCVNLPSAVQYFTPACHLFNTIGNH